MARPTKLTPELADKICGFIQEGYSLRSICKPTNMPALSTVMLWKRKNKEFSEQYAHAREDAGEMFGSDIIELAQAATPENIQKQKLLIDSLKWAASRMAPKLFGEKQSVEHTGSNGGEIQIIRRVIVDPTNGTEQSDS